MEQKVWATARKALVVTSIILIVFLIFATEARAAKYKTLYTFTGGTDGAYLGANLTFDSAGNLYSTTNLGGAYGYGTVFQLTPNGDGSWSESVIHSFNGADGSTPTSGSPIFDLAGNLYGTTNQGGDYGAGAVFELTPNGDGSWTESVIHSFNGADGSQPIAGLIFDQAGNLYGTTTAGGVSGGGTVFQLAPNGDGTWTESVLHSFSGGDGSGPTANLALDSAGNLYGTSLYGGAYGEGTVFELIPNADGTWTESVLHSFSGRDGRLPWWGLIFDHNGNAYGTTWAGGAYDGGTIFRLKPNGDGSWKETVLYSFPTNGPGNIVLDSAGSFYGITMKGGTYGYGTVFRLKYADGAWQSTVYSFRNHPGAYPFAGVILDSAGNLYSTTYGDGSTTFGSVFEIVR